MSSGPAVSKRHTSRLFTVHRKMTPACFRHARAHDPHVARSTQVVGSAADRAVTKVKSAPPARAPFSACPNNVSCLCMAQARGLLSVCKSRGSPFDPFTCARAVRAAPTAALSRAVEGSLRETGAQDNQGNAKTRNTKEQEGEPPSQQGPCRGGLRGPGKSPAGATCPTPTKRATLEPKGSKRRQQL